MPSKYIHIIIAASNWHLDSVKYRRHRLAEYLSNHEDTKRVFWIFPLSSTPRKPLTYIDAFNQQKIGFYDLNKKIRICGLPDIIPGRYQRVKSALHGKSLITLKSEINSYKESRVLWFTKPCFPFIINVSEWKYIIYDCSDLWEAPRGGYENYISGISRKLEVAAEDVIIDKSNFIYASSDYLAERIRSRSSRQVIVVENGVDFNIFRSKKIENINNIFYNIPKPRLGFVGGMKNKINFTLLSKLAKVKKEYSIVLIGPGPKIKNQGFTDLLDKNNVYWLGGIEPEVVPSYLRYLDLGLLPYKEIEYNKAVFPLKMFEYLAVGIPVVGCGLPSTNKYKNEKCFIHTSEKHFINACEMALSWGSSKETISKRKKMAENAAWEHKFKYIYDTTFGKDI